MDENAEPFFSDEDSEVFIRMDVLDILSRMGTAFSYLTRMQENIPYDIARAQRKCRYEKGMLSRMFQAVARHQCRVELEMYPIHYARLANNFADMCNRIIDSKPGTDYTAYASEMEDKAHEISTHMDFIKNRIRVIAGTEKKQKFELN